MSHSCETCTDAAKCPAYKWHHLTTDNDARTGLFLYAAVAHVLDFPFDVRVVAGVLGIFINDFPVAGFPAHNPDLLGILHGFIPLASGLAAACTDDEKRVRVALTITATMEMVPALLVGRVVGERRKDADNLWDNLLSDLSPND